MVLDAVEGGGGRDFEELGLRSGTGSERASEIGCWMKRDIAI